MHKHRSLQNVSWLNWSLTVLTGSHMIECVYILDMNWQINQVKSDILCSRNLPLYKIHYLKYKLSLFYPFCRLTNHCWSQKHNECHTLHCMMINSFYSNFILTLKNILNGWQKHIWWTALNVSNTIMNYSLCVFLVFQNNVTHLQKSIFWTILHHK